MGDMLLVTLVSMILYTDGMLPGEKILKDGSPIFSNQRKSDAKSVEEQLVKNFITDSTKKHQF
jgi:hypothetical protein